MSQFVFHKDKASPLTLKQHEGKVNNARIFILRNLFLKVVKVNYFSKLLLTIYPHVILSLVEKK